MKTHWIIFLVSFALISCQKSEYFGPVYHDSNDSINIYSSKIIIGCEGNFQYSNASISIIDPTNWTSIDNAYKAQNQVAIGDVLQSFYLKGDTLVAVVNNSHEIILININTFEKLTSYSNFSAPRYVEFINDSLICVSDLYANFLTIFDIKKDQIIKQVSTLGWTERLLIQDSMIVVANIDRNSLQFIDKHAFTLKKELLLQHEPMYLFKDQSNNLLVVGKDTNAGYFFTLINNKSEILNHQSLESTISYADLYQDNLYFCTNKSVYKFDYQNNMKIKLFDHKAITPYGFKISNGGQYLVLNDALDYISRGETQVYSFEGHLLHTFRVGYIPQAIIFAF